MQKSKRSGARGAEGQEWTEELSGVVRACVSETEGSE